MYTASKPLASAAAHLMWLGFRLGAARLMPGRGQLWDPGLPPETLIGLDRQWRAVAGDVEAVCVYRRPQPTRSGLTLIVCGRHRGMLVRLRRDRTTLQRELDVAVAAERLRPTSIRVPQLLQEATYAGWYWAGYELISTGPHRPARSLPPEALAEISALVSSVVPRPVSAPEHWTACHGDLTPWNLRRTGRSPVPWLLDWETAGWAPPGFDAVYFEASAAAVTTPRSARRRAPTAGYAEAATHAAAAIRARPDDDPQLTERMLRTLDAIASR